MAVVETVVVVVVIAMALVVAVMKTWHVWWRRWRRARVNSPVAENEFCKQMKTFVLAFSLF